jgi:hypothetical protein
MGNTTPKPVNERPQTIEEFEIKYQKSCRSSHNQKVFKEGICHGMCLDWVRSMLNDSGARFMDYHSMKFDSLKKVYSMEARIHNVYNKVGEKLIQASLQAATELRLQAEHKQRKARRLQQHGLQLLDSIENTERRLRGVLSDSERTVLEINVRAMDRDIGLINDIVDRNVNFVQATERRILQLNQQMKNDEVMFHHFYSYFRQNFREWIKDGEDFSDIVAGVGRYEDFGSDTLGDWFSKIRTCLFQLQTRQCALLNFRRGSDDPKDPGAGHYIAFARMNARFHLFDPNVGWYEAEGLDAIMELFKDLWSAGYIRSNYRKSIWRVFYTEWPWQVDPRLPLGHAIL